MKNVSEKKRCLLVISMLLWTACVGGQPTIGGTPSEGHLPLVGSLDEEQEALWRRNFSFPWPHGDSIVHSRYSLIWSGDASSHFQRKILSGFHWKAPDYKLELSEDKLAWGNWTDVNLDLYRFTDFGFEDSFPDRQTGSSGRCYVCGSLSAVSDNKDPFYTAEGGYDPRVFPKDLTGKATDPFYTAEGGYNIDVRYQAGHYLGNNTNYSKLLAGSEELLVQHLQGRDECDINEAEFQESIDLYIKISNLIADYPEDADTFRRKNISNRNCPSDLLAYRRDVKNYLISKGRWKQ